MADGTDRMISIADLRVGSETVVSYYDENGVLLIARGVVVTESLIEKLKRHGIVTLHVDAAESAPPALQQDPASWAAERVREAQGSLAGTAGVDLVAEKELALNAYSRQKLERIKRLHDNSVGTVATIADSLIKGRKVDLRSADPVIDGYTRELADDPDPVVASTLLYEANLELAQRCVQFATLSLAVALRLDVGGRALREVGQAALLHDLALFELPPEERFPHGLRDIGARRRYQQHPLLAESMMQSVDGSSFTMVLLVAQVHELMNGTGFPRRLSHEAIHPMARLLSVVDAYLTLTSPPSGHPRVVPCDAIAFVLKGVSDGQYAPRATTGLLETLTTYPIGSMVELSDTRRARVVRSNGQDYGYPIVQLESQPGELIDLKESSVFVTRPVLSSVWNEVRLPESITDLSS